MSRRSLETAVIAASGTTSGPIDARNWNQFAIIKPATTGTAITVTVSTTRNGTYTALLSSGSTAVSLTAQAAAGTYPLSSEIGKFPWFKLVSGSTEAAERSIVVVKSAF